MITTILAVDLGKFNIVIVRYEPATRATAFRTTPTELRCELGQRPVWNLIESARTPTECEP
jgi:hypothetical protein